MNSSLALLVDLHGFLRILGRQNFKARTFENAASCLAHKRLVLNQKDGAPAWEIVREYVVLKSHTILNSLSGELFITRMPSPSSPERRALHQRLHLFGSYFGLLRIVCLGSSTILPTPPPPFTPTPA